MADDLSIKDEVDSDADPLATDGGTHSGACTP